MSFPVVVGPQLRHHIDLSGHDAERAVYKPGVFQPPEPGTPPLATIPGDRRATWLSAATLLGSDSALIDHAGGVLKYIGPAPETAFSRFETLPSVNIEAGCAGFDRVRDLMRFKSVLLVQADDALLPSGDVPGGATFQVYLAFMGSLYIPQELNKFRDADIRTLARAEVSGP